MYLPEGITSHAFDDSNTAHQHYQQFKQVLYPLVKAKQGEILSIEEAHFCSYHLAKINLKDDPIYILLHATYPYVSVASEVDFFKAIFIYHPFAQELKPYYEIIPLDYLEQTVLLKRAKKGVISLNIDNQLSQHELRDVVYWKPSCIGDIIFNHWD
ncbi:hypothetical protein [Alkalihalobacillus pseudalcaliphilus]|uniref:hypothetical protein n=1 Tax=Alkalihalobacillus pseudalcaliphilus TaxID=79884 RepID=UPI00064E146C|nr:hypothetical protein [Alkalihalobacillus pseudalcaliphilus]KMK77722.1 hypothetical protein AB990_04505 [Alkalihalobacillus pseudalcaliphilus]